MVRIMDDLKVSEWIERFPGVTEAAAALGVNRVSLWRWVRNGDVFPKAWGYKARGLPRGRRRNAQNRSGATNAPESGVG